MDERKRSITKTLTWRALATLSTVVVAYIMTGKLAISASIGGILVVWKLILYYLHERAWNMTAWGVADE